METRQNVNKNSDSQDESVLFTEIKDYHEIVEERREKIIYYLKIATWVAIGFFILSLLLESWMNISMKTTGSTGNLRRGIQTTPKFQPVKKAGLYKYFPPNLTGYHLKGRKDLESQQFPKAEAVYEPEDMNLQLMAPITIYGQIIYIGDQTKAEEIIQDKLSEYPSDQKNTVLFNTYAVSGFKTDDKAYFIGFIYKGMIVWFRSEYLEIIPNLENRRSILESHCRKVAEETVKYIERVEAGEGEDEAGI